MPSQPLIPLLPTRSRYSTGADVEIEVRTAGPGRLVVRHLGAVVGTADAAGPGTVSLGALAAGGYGVDLETADGTPVARTAVLVTDEPRGRMRYGFVASYAPDKDVAAVVDLARRLHLDAVQLYDWAYRHADLMGGGETYADPLGQPIALDTVRRLAAGLAAAGTDALGYAAVYGVGSEEWPAWSHRALLRADGEAWSLGDFLTLVDPGAPDWQEHLVGDLRAAVAAVGLHGFHLDQYGYPRWAGLVGGGAVDLSRSFRALIEAVRTGLPDARLVFNNVNDFPTRATADAPQDAVYIEVWPPHTTLGSLARLVERARAARDGRPVVIAAYQHVYEVAPRSEADLSTSFTMATLFSHGATQLLAGEQGNLLVDPYYVRNRPAEPETLALLQRWYDFLVEHDELLMAPGAADVSGAWVGAYNDALDVRFAAAPTTDGPTPGGVWRRVVQVGELLVVHLINLAGQADTEWDAPRAVPADPGAGTLRVKRAGSAVPVVRVADPDRGGHLTDVAVELDGEDAVAVLPPPHVWQTVVVDLRGRR
ncbi:MAG: hypothetical protein BGO37_15800 [Cellulomonas sp. 73-92]|uniref:glycoside hydrolase family 66 protein n=1 Tax=Cellulomonas sp. 73-92 TaxID=1895740 RepID=UPI000926B54E|nr:glycoside hydrolase family 66 protein [Cellulomonas sp. 73-92]OJV80975.1 MAG: hypothetical protein BGO37_15800 [Cellulomonas sp. 73-92]